MATETEQFWRWSSLILNDKCCFSKCWSRRLVCPTLEPVNSPLNSSLCLHLVHRIWNGIKRLYCHCAFQTKLLLWQNNLKCVLFPVPLQSSGDHPRPAVLWGHRHVVPGLRHRRALPGVAPLPGGLGVRSGNSRGAAACQHTRHTAWCV